MNITFTLDNDVYEEEKYCGVESFECYDDDDNRYICYVDDCDITEHIELMSKNIEGEINRYCVDKLYLNEVLVYHKNMINMYYT